MTFSHLHCHTQYSLLDGAASISKLFKKAAADGMPAVAITDHGNMFGVFDFVAEASKHKGVKPIVGCEFYVVEDRHQKTFTKDKRDRRFHQLFLAKNTEGYQNLVKLCSTGFIEGLYSKYPRIDKELILKHHKGLIATTCCLGAMVPQMILTKGESAAKKEFEWWLDLFGDDYYVELQRHKLKDQETVNEVLLRFASDYNVKVIASNDSHYTDKQDANAHDILLCINTGEKQATPKMDDFIDEETSKKNTRFAFPNDEFYFKTTAEMTHLFKDIPAAIDNTNEIVGKVEHLKLKQDIMLPNFVIPQEFQNQDDYLHHITYMGAKERYQDLTPEIEERLNFELFTVKTMGFAGYFLIVADFIKAGRDLGVLIGPGRGCLTGDAKVVMSNGETKDLAEVQIGDSVWTEDGSLRRVTNRFEYPVEETLLNVKTYYGEETGITLTKDHKVFAEKLGRPKGYENWAEITRKSRKMLDPTGNLSWLPASELEVGDWVFVPTPKMPRFVDVPQSYNFIPKSYSNLKNKFENELNTEGGLKIDFAQFSNNSDLRHDAHFVYHDVLNVAAKKIQKTKQVARFLELDEDWFKIMGIFAGDGWFRKDYRPEISFVFNLKDVELIAFFKNKMADCGFEISEYFYGKTVQIHVRNKHLYLLFKQLFNRYEAEAHSKHVPNCVVNGSENTILSFLKGYLAADGHESKHKIKFTTVSRMLADQVRFICWKVGIPASLATDKRVGDTREMFKNRTLAYMVSIPKDERIGEKQAEDIYVYRRTEGGILLKIRAISEVENIEKVYDIEVEKNHNYLTSSFLVHNSAAGSAVAYCIGITNIDPIKYNLLFERFLNPDRKSMPDIDTDFDDEGRQKVIDYVVNKYGKQQVAHIVTYGTMAAKMSIKDVARVMDLPLSDANNMAKLVSDKPGIKLNRLLTAPLTGEGGLTDEGKENLRTEDVDNAKLLREILADKNDPRSAVLREALILEGSVRGTGIHAAGIIIAPKDLTEILPVCTSKDVNLLITQFEGSIIEDAGVIKMDFLGLKTLTIIRDALRLIKENHGRSIEIDGIPLDDKKTYELYQRGETNATFQFESPGMQKHLRELKPDKFADLIAMNALYRPGPLQYIPNFINRKHGREKVVYDLDAMEEYLHETYGICVTGDTLIHNPRTGERARIDTLENRVGEFYVQGVDADLQPKAAPITHWVCNGKKAVVEVKLQNGSRVKMTPDHRVLTEKGWQEIGKLKAGDTIAAPRQLINIVEQVKEVLDLPQTFRNMNVRWEEIESITPAGEELVYDITVAEIHNFVGNNVILHNCVYQEQIMLLSQKLANFSKGDADVLRKAMGKKQIAVLNKMKPKFLEGCEANGHLRATCEKVWTDWEAFAAYAFNKSHSTCYAFVAYQTAYLKAHYPSEYMAAVLSNNQSNIDKITFFMEECRNASIPVKGPDVNESNVRFSVNKQGDVRFALSAIKGVGEAAVESIVEERKNGGPFTDIFDFMRRINLRTVSKKVMECLAQAGGFDSFGINRAAFFAPSEKYDTFIEHLSKFGAAHQQQKASSENSLFGGSSDVMIAAPSVPKVDEWHLIQKLNYEKDCVGIYLSGHPLDDFKMEVSFANVTLDRIQEYRNQKVKIAAFVAAANHRISKKGTGFGSFTLQDYTGSYEFSMFNEDYAKFRYLLEPGASVFIDGDMKPRWNSAEEQELKIKEVRQLANIGESMTESITLMIPIEQISHQLIEDLDMLCLSHKGKHKLKIQFLDAQNRQTLHLFAADKKITVDSNFIAAVESQGLKYRLN